MSLLDRYLHEVGKHLPRKNREDILKELRSSLTDALENEAGPDSTDEQVSAMLKEFGEPRKVAARYHPEGQYLIGPALYPLFQMVASIAVAAAIGAQILAWAVTYFLAGKPVNTLESVAGMINSLPAIIGWVVIIFAVLQNFDVQPDKDEKPWDPASLPQVESNDNISRTEKVTEIIFQTIFLAILTGFSADKVVFTGGKFFGNPVISQYIGLLLASLLISIGLNVYLTWQGRWTKTSRWAQFFVNIFDIVLLSLLVLGHQTWLQAHDVTSFQAGIEAFTRDVVNNWEIIMMSSFWLGFSVALIVTVIETGVTIFKTVSRYITRTA